MNFSHPGWLVAGGLAVAAMLWTWRIADTRQRDSLQLFIGSRLRAGLTRSISVAKRNTRRTLFALAVLLLATALAGPRAGYRWEEVKRRGNDIIFAVDTSRSMSTPDVKPNRLARAKLAIGEFVERLNGDAVGLVAFAGSAFLQCPITLDYGAFRESLASLDTHIIPRGGTNITSAIHEAQAALQRRPDSDKVMILVTDGENLEGDALAAAKSAAQQDGLKIYTVGVGSANGDLIPLPADQGGGYLKDRNGQLVKSRLDENSLKALAAATGGTYAPLGAQNQGLDSIYRQALAPLAKRDLEARSQKIAIERYQWPLGAALALLLASLLMGSRRRVPLDDAQIEPTDSQRVPRSPQRFASPALAILGALAALSHAPRAHASPTSAAEAYAHGNFSVAQQQFAAAAAKDPQHPLLQYDAGTAAYRAGAYPQAVQAFQASVNAVKSNDARRLSEQQDAYYDLGNSLYREGEATEKSDRAATIDSWTRAVKSYDAALQLKSEDADSHYNRDLVSRKLEALKQQQAQDKKQSQDKQQSPDKKPSQDKKQSPQQSAKNDSGGATKDTQKAQQSPGDQGKGDQGKGEQGKGDPSKGAPKQAGQQPGQTPGQTPTPAASQPGTPSPQPGATPRSSATAQSGEKAAAGDDQRTPGGMSRQEARELMDSVKNEEKGPPTAPMARNGGQQNPVDEPLKDW